MPIPLDIQQSLKYLVVTKQSEFLKAYEMLSPSQYEEVLSIAKKNNLRVAGHVPLSMDIITASKLGLSSLEHVKNLEMWATHDRENLLKQRRKILKNHKNKEFHQSNFLNLSPTFNRKMA